MLYRLRAESHLSCKSSFLRSKSSMFKIWSTASKDSSYLLVKLSFYLVNGLIKVLEPFDSPEHYLVKLRELALSLDWLIILNG